MSRRSLMAGVAAAATGAALAVGPTATAIPDRDPDPRPDRSPSPSASATPGKKDPAPVLGSSAQDRYIVVFDKATGKGKQRAARSGARSDGGTVHHRFDTVLDGFAATLPAQALRGLRNNPNVAYIEADRKVTVADTESPATWGIDRVDQRDLPLDGSYTFEESGAGVTAYVIDTGIRSGHAEFSGRVTSGYSAINDGRGTGDCNGHGTHVAGTVGGETYGVAQDVDLVAVRVLDCEGSGTTSGVIAGVDWVTQNASGSSVANMSLGGGASTALDNAVANSIDAGVTYAVAAGNDYGANACNGSPSRVTSALTVGSSTNSDSRSGFSNIGTCLDLFAPGSNITSAWIGSNSDTNTISGTSMATPHVAGVAALYLEANPGASATEVSDAVVDSSTSGALSGIGSGSPNRLLYSGLDSSGGNPDPEPTGCDSLTEGGTGQLSGSGATEYWPKSNGYFNAAAGTHVGCLSGPASADFDLYLDKYQNGTWVEVARSTSSSSEEEISYDGTSGYYSWRVESWSGSGSYSFGYDTP
ncbi:S8 family peptidase [Nocardioides panacisoli]|uniref:S8 family peptidase n=1 Tax=Nocardioides panacisoli TaxID=627624 RepID=UPI001C63AF0D|nr:S8 family peptidase [Nocardioides panacisoli]QYJ04636.1 S8 family peptidase [Nocardioides panacisoli]